MTIASILHSIFSPQPKPKTGDRRTTKNGGLQIRIPFMIYDSDGHPIACRCTGGRQSYEWRKPSELPPDFRHLLTDEENKSYAAETRRPRYSRRHSAKVSRSAAVRADRR